MNDLEEGNNLGIKDKMKKGLKDSKPGYLSTSSDEE